MTELSWTTDSRPAGARHALILALCAAVSLSACGGAGDDGDRAGSAPAQAPSAPTPSATTTSGDQDVDAAEGTPIRIGFGDTEVAARLLDNPTARGLSAQLPLTLTFRDHNRVEKTAPSPRELSIDGAPAGHDPAAGDIGYFAPGGDVVLYYDDDAGYFEGIVPIGRFTGDTEAIRRLPDGSRVTIAGAG
jgi:hypothetical protein